MSEKRIIRNLNWFVKNCTINEDDNYFYEHYTAHMNQRMLEYSGKEVIYYPERNYVEGFNGFTWYEWMFEPKENNNGNT